MLFGSFVNDLIIKLLSILKFSKKFVIVIITGEWYMGIIIDGHCYFHWFLGELFVWEQLNTFRLIVILLLLLLLLLLYIIIKNVDIDVKVAEGAIKSDYWCVSLLHIYLFISLLLLLFFFVF